MKTMNDLISRQAAINAYGDWYVEEGTEEGFIGTVKQLLEGLPSAQPDLSDYSDKLWRNAYERGKEEARIQKMQDLEQAEIQRAYELGKLDAMEEMPHWIPCSERLPEEYGEYICTMENGQVQECGFVPDNRAGMIEGWSTCEADGYKLVLNTAVIAWMPLPECYRGEEK